MDVPKWKGTIERDKKLTKEFFLPCSGWAGLKLTKKKTVIITNPAFQFDQSRMDSLGISKREYEVLELMAKDFPTRK